MRDLQSLLNILKQSRQQYIRCFRPNVNQKPGIFDGELVFGQMKESGTLNLVEVMHKGYPYRQSFQEVASRFQSKMPARYASLEPRAFIDLLMKYLQVDTQDYCLGCSKLFLKSGTFSKVQQLLENPMDSSMDVDFL